MPSEPVHDLRCNTCGHPCQYILCRGCQFGGKYPEGLPDRFRNGEPIEDWDRDSWRVWIPRRAEGRIEAAWREGRT